MASSVKHVQRKNLTLELKLLNFSSEFARRRTGTANQRGDGHTAMLTHDVLGFVLGTQNNTMELASMLTVNSLRERS